MRTMHRSLLALVLAATPAAAQNFVTNGDFSAGITGWTEAGFSINPVVESFDTTGLGASQSYGCNPGGQVAPGPYPPNSIEQSVTLATGVPYEFTAEIAVSRVANTANADAGTLWVEVGGVEVTRTVLGGYVAGRTQRARLCARFTVATGGPQTLKVFFHRGFTANTDTPRSHIDDVRLVIAPGPTFCLRGNRRLGLARTVEVLGEANQPVAFFLSGGRLNPGIQVPGVIGTWFLDPTVLSLFFTGATDANGLYAFSLTLPNDLSLLTAVVWVQGLSISPVPQITLGHDQFLTFVQ